MVSLAELRWRKRPTRCMLSPRTSWKQEVSTCRNSLLTQVNCKRESTIKEWHLMQIWLPLRLLIWMSHTQSEPLETLRSCTPENSWNVIVLDVTDVAHMAKPTKGHIVSIMGRFYDPLGFLSPVVISFKILFQELCKSRLGWDQPLSGASLSKWQSLISDLEWCQSISIPRCFLEGICQEVEVYGFAKR